MVRPHEVVTLEPIDRFPSSATDGLGSRGGLGS
jgi:hypothetical protein